MANIPQAILECCPPSRCLNPPSRGKVRDIYELPDHPDKLLVVASDRISIFDFVLNALVPDKGSVLNALNVFWRQQIASFTNHDLMASGSAIDEYLPESLRGNADLQCRAVVVKKLRIVPVECVARGYLTGSGWDSYQKNGTVCGHKLPAGLQNGSRLPFPIFTPSTKADVGHDEHLNALTLGDYLADGCLNPLSTRDELEKLANNRQLAGRLERLTLQLYEFGAQYARDRGLILVDTKFEFGLDEQGNLVLADEVLTPDSSRYWDAAAWEKARAKGELPPSLDKQYVRDWGTKLGINWRDTGSDHDLAWVHERIVPDDIIAKTTQLFRYIFWRPTGMKLEQIQREILGVAVEPRPVRVDIMLGSQSDLGNPEVEDAFRVLSSHPDANGNTTRVHVCSCHRNPEALRAYAEQLTGVDVVVACAGKAAMLPGSLAGWLDHFGKTHIPVIGVGLPDKNLIATAAAKLAIEELPGQPVVLQPDGRAYSSVYQACRAATGHEFLPRQPEVKPAAFNVHSW